MKTIATAVMLLSYFPATGQAGDQAGSLKTLISKVESVIRRTSSDHTRNDPSGFDDTDVSDATPKEIDTAKRILSDLMTDLNASASKPFRDLQPNQLAAAQKRLRARAFDHDCRIADKHVDAIIDFFVKYPSLDPHVLSLRFIDDKTASDPAGSHPLILRKNRL